MLKSCDIDLRWFNVIQGQSSMPSRVTVHSFNRKSIVGFLSDFHCVQHCGSMIFDAKLLHKSQIPLRYPRLVAVALMEGTSKTMSQERAIAYFDTDFIPYIEGAA